ncbi:hypothetical protein HYS49_00490 [Candidatus Woesearchaeota archaeon]|nr:hypothetical protein [Candidatus Woesearchaeota archaeon]
MTNHERIDVELLVLRALALKRDGSYRQLVELQGTIERNERGYFTPLPRSIVIEMRTREGINFFPDRIMVYHLQRESEKVFPRFCEDGFLYPLRGEFLLFETTTSSIKLNCFSNKGSPQTERKTSYFLSLMLDALFQEDQSGKLSLYGGDNLEGALTISEEEGALSVVDEDE